jgi:predicted  nucleic acid-binding Zn-ribbon protein
MNKWQELFSITKDITILKSKNINTKDLEQQQARLTTAIENNNAKILWLKNELVAPQARLERLQNRDERIEWKLGDKFKDIANVLQTEIDKRTAVIEQLDNQQVVTALTKEIATITLTN